MSRTTMRTLVIVSALLGVAPIGSGAAAAAAVLGRSDGVPSLQSSPTPMFPVQGVLQPNAPPPVAPQRGSRGTIAPDGSMTVINFDDQYAPCMFADTTALRDAYRSLGVLFEGPGARDGGAIVDECGNFYVYDYSRPAFLAFNLSGAMADGGFPRGPEVISFLRPVTQVQINVGHDQGGQVTLEAFSPAGELVASDSLRATNALQTLTVAAERIARVRVSFTGTVLVADDLAFVRPSDFEMARFEPSTVGLRFEGAGADAFGLAAAFELDPTSDGIDLGLDDVTVSLGASIAWTIPAGSFVCDTSDCSFESTLPGITRAKIDVAHGLMAFAANAVDLQGASNPVTIQVRVGNDFGTASVRLRGALSSGSTVAIPAPAVLSHPSTPASSAPRFGK